MKLVKLFSVLFLVLSVSVVGALYYFEQGVHQALNISQPTIYQVKSGQSAKGVLNRLKTAGIIEQNIGLKVRLKWQPELTQIKAGTYQLTPEMTGLDALQLFTSGKEIQFSVEHLQF